MRKVVTYPNDVLTTPTQAVTHITQDTIELLDDMYDIMLEEDGIGLAANQLGESVKIAIVELDDESGLIEMINPVILEEFGKEIDVEGCLSFPDVYGTVERAETIKFWYVNREGVSTFDEASGYLARAIQHEIEHLNGGLFTDKIIERLTPEELEAYMEDKEYD